VSRPAFREHYETLHAPLALRYLRCFRRYVRNHVVAAVPVEPPFDALSEFWYDDERDVEAVIDLLTSPAGETLREDEARFMDRAGIRIIRVTEELLFGPARATESGVVEKEALLLHRAPGVSAAAFRAGVAQVCATLLEPRSTGFVRLQLDLPATPDAEPLACDAVLTAWPDVSGQPSFGALPELPGIAATTRLRLESVETPPELLRD
jgi:uncharacterized protein (TIGR02118 family)